jgi:hypothetical protein
MPKGAAGLAGDSVPDFETWSTLSPPYSTR